MFETLGFEIGTEFPVDADEQVPVERRGHAEAVVVSRVEHCRIFSQIDADQKPAAAADQLGDLPQQSVGLGRFEIAEGRTGEVDDPPRGSDRQRELGGEIGADGVDREAGVLRLQLIRGQFQMLA